MITETESDFAWLGMVLAAVIYGRPSIHRAEWLSANEPQVDIQLGDHNDWWLRQSEDVVGFVYTLQARHPEFYRSNCPVKGELPPAKIAFNLSCTAEHLREYGYDIRLPWTKEEAYRAWSEFLEKGCTK